jgi:hypothetical protein|tara:strand:+ start:8657 stop:8827 length:171 start_codon:yes stop_codon:yes gene_type:complete
MVVSTDLKKRICVGCGDTAKVHDKKWYCSIDFETRHGACKRKKSIHAIPKELLDVS